MDNQPLEKDYLTIKEAASYIGVSPQTLRRWDKEAKLKPIRHPGNAYRYYKKTDLEPFKLEYQRAEQKNPGVLFSTAVANIESNKKLREPQREAHRAVREHFSTNKEPVTIQIPVGCGKTGIIATLPFGLINGRALIIAPNTTIRKGIFDSLEVGNPKFFLSKTKVLSSFSSGPFVAVLDGPDANIHDCTESQYVVTNIQQLASSADRWLPQFPSNFFEMILVDEGHHNVAESWKKVFDKFQGAKVVSLTATPFRSDGKKVAGEVIYRYPYSQAMLAGYIKQIHSINVAPSEIYFTYKGDSHKQTLEEVMSLRDEAWFRKGIALAPECNSHIVDVSIQKMRELRGKTGLKQQIIAVACSVDHARQIRALYEQRGIKAKEIYGEMNKLKKTKVIQELEDGLIDCIVQVQMLGEGFDHPPLGVAAIFRPFRSLSPYVQFVGRIMRVMFQDDPGNSANHGYIVSHIGLSNDENWKDFRDFDLEDQKVFREWLESQPIQQNDSYNTSTDDSIEKSRRFDEGMLVHSEIISSFLKQSFLDPNDDRALSKILNTTVPGVGIPLKSLISKKDLKVKLIEEQKKIFAENLEPIPVSPQRRRRSTKIRLADRTKSVAARVLKDVGFTVIGFELSKLFPEFRGTQNFIATTRLVHTEVNHKLGINKNERNKPNAIEMEKVFEELDQIGDSIVKKIKKASK